MGRAQGSGGAARPAAWVDRQLVAPLDPGAASAVTALVRALELHDPAAARRGAYRAAVVAAVAPHVALSPEARRDALLGALVSDVAALVTHAAGAGPDPASAVLAAALLDRVPALAGAARAVRHATERWDGAGGPHGLAGEAIPASARLLAATVTMVGPIDEAGMPAWSTRAGRVRALAGTVLDPTLAEAVAARLSAHPVDEPGLGVDRALLLLDGLGRRGDERSPLDSLASINAAIVAATRLDDVLALVGEHALDAVRADSLGIARVDHDDDALHVLVNVGALAPGDEHFPADHTLALASLPAFTVFHTGAPHLLGRTGTDPADPEHRYLVSRSVQSEIAVPILLGERTWGHVWASTLPGHRELDGEDLRTLQLVASQLAASVAQAQRLADLEQFALRDPLTGLGNRRVLDSTLRAIFARPPVARQDVAVVMCDIDGLKAVNDTLGHSAGDLLLTEAANALRNAVVDVPTATVCRIGGDEFCVIVDGGGQLLGEPLAARAQKLYARTGEGRSMSCGVAVAGLDVHAPGELLRRADEAQYKQKHSRPGRTTLPAVPPAVVGRRRAHR